MRAVPPWKWRLGEPSRARGQLSVRCLGLETDNEVGFRLKRKETADLFDSEDMQAAFINVS